LRHSSLQTGNDIKAYIFTNSMPVQSNIKLCRIWYYIIKQKITPYQLSDIVLPFTALFIILETNGLKPL